SVADDVVDGRPELVPQSTEEISRRDVIGRGGLVMLGHRRHGWPTGSGTRAGNLVVKVEPWPYVLMTVRSPPIIRQNARLIANPRPVPPYLDRVDASACENASNRRPSCSSVIPMPVSETANVIQSSGSRCTIRLMAPWSVNLAAFDSRLNSV